MITVLFGTNPYQFGRLKRVVEILSEITDERLVVQAGNSDLTGLDAEVHDFVDYRTILDWMKASRLIISQGGFGSLKDAIRSGKPVLALPRKPELGESTDVQEELVGELEKLGYIKVVRDVENIAGIIKDLKTGNMEVKESEIPRLVSAYVDECLGNM